MLAIHRVSIALTVCAASACSAPVYAQCAGPADVLASPSAPAPDLFGGNVAVQGDVMVVGAHGDDTGGMDAGIAHVFRRIAGVWTYEATLADTMPDPIDIFGRGVAINGDRIAIGGDSDDTLAFNSGVVVTFRRVAGVWTLEQRILPVGLHGDREGFGADVALHGGTMIVGAGGAEDAGIGTGAAYIYEFDGAQWQFATRLTPPNPRSFLFFGDSVDLHGDTAVVGSWGDPNFSQAGAVFVYRRIAGAWQEVQKINDFACFGCNFGRRVSFDGQSLLITTPGAFTISEAAGAVYAYRFDGAQWVFEHEFFPQEGVFGETFGVAVSVADGVALISSQTDLEIVDPNDPNNVETVELRAAYVFRKSFGDLWEEVDRFSGPDDGTIYGFKLATDGATAAVGAFRRGADGEVYLHDLADCSPCPGDVDGDQNVDLDDLLFVLGNFGDNGDDVPGDVNRDGGVDLDDLLLLLGVFGASC